ncbi:MAG: class I SAM-dependent methyltransferase [Planctomycetota bacterium]
MVEIIRDAEAIHDAHTDDRGDAWHMFVPSDAMAAYQALRSVPRGDGFFLEWGSGLGTITLIAAALGFTASGIEIRPELVQIARSLALKHDLSASFVVGNFIADWYVHNPLCADPDMRSEVCGEDGYEQLGLDLEDFSVIYAFPWPGEEDLFLDLFEHGARRGAHLICNHGSDGMRITRHR